MILQLGDIQFSTDMSLSDLQRQTAWQWEEIPILGQSPVLQFSHTRAPTLNFKGVYWNYTRHANKLADIERMANEKTPRLLINTNGESYGFWVIESMTSQGSIFRYGQSAPVRNAWNLKLKYYGEAAA